MMGALPERLLGDLTNTGQRGSQRVQDFNSHRLH